MEYNITSATTRGSILVEDSDSFGEQFDQNQWLSNRDNGYGNLPIARVNQDVQDSIGASWNNFTFGNWRAAISRYFMAFSTMDSGFTTQITSATLWVHFGGDLANNIMVVQADKPSTTTNISAADFFQISGYNTGGSMSGNTTDYIATPVAPTDGWNAISLNANAIDAFNTQPDIRLALVDYNYDYLYLSPPTDSILYTALNISGTAPYLVVETGTPGLGQYVLSISPGATFKVNSVPQGNIKLVNRLEVPAFYQFYRTPIGGSDNVFETNPGCAPPYEVTEPLFAAKSLAALSTGDIVYTNSLLTFPYNGGGLYFGLNQTQAYPASGTYWDGGLYEISTEGVIGDTSASCGF
jgi:hypothetical protein